MIGEYNSFHFLEIYSMEKKISIMFMSLENSVTYYNESKSFSTCSLKQKIIIRVRELADINSL